MRERREDRACERSCCVRRRTRIATERSLAALRRARDDKLCLRSRAAFRRAVHQLRGIFRICRFCQMLMKSSAQSAPIRAMNMSCCVSQTSPCVPRKAFAAAPD